MSLRIFIGWDSRFPAPGQVLAYTLRKHASGPLDIRFLDYRHLRDCYNFEREHDPLATTEFTYSRFLVPYLCGYEGTALFLDNDMACFADIYEIAQYLSREQSLAVVQHEHNPTATTKMYGVQQTSYPRKNWSSLMLMNCDKLGLWTRRTVETASGAYLHRFEDIPDYLIGSIPKVWNSLDAMDEHTKIIHWTSGGPWFEQCRDCPHADVWKELFAEACTAKAVTLDSAIKQARD